MPRQQARLVHHDSRVDDVLSTGEVCRRYAVANRDSGHPAETWVTAPQVVPASEDPSDTALRNALCGSPEAYETERWCRACGPLTSDGEAPLCDCGRRIMTRRIVTRRAEPLDFGPMIKVEQQDTETDPDSGKTIKVLKRHVIYDRLSRVRLMLPDETEKKARKKLGIAGNPSPDKMFLLAPR